ncbi:circularly permuted type 2 ATP-grasp protein [Candidatus Poribacteria bacterium]|nr:circularly permuted type 2 ATP-grasp protein [Candidatus Poribacteria bacterium]
MVRLATMTATGTEMPALLANYRSPEGVWDELVNGDGVLRPHWAPLLEHLHGVEQADLARRAESIRRSLLESGLDDAPGNGGGLSPLPLLLSPGEWRTIEDGLEQRARLLDRLLEDLYHRQLGLRQDLLPPEVLFTQPSFLRPLHGVKPPRDLFLHLYAADLIRGRDGRWRVLRDEGQVPSGLARVIENRLALLRSAPDAWKGLPIRRYMPFFNQLRETLEWVSPCGNERPRVVLLGAGPLAGTHTAHTYLARHLGLTLAEGSDLTTREDRVYMKTLGSLLPVHGILRGVADYACDPLELDYESAHGVAGLVQAARAGSVAVANALGSGVLDSPGLLPFLPELCRALLGEDLKLPPVESVWGGWSGGVARLLEDETLLVRRVRPARGWSDKRLCGLEGAARERLRERIRHDPRDFVGCAVPPASSAPVLTGDGVLPRPVTLRCFAAAGSSGYKVLPGGIVTYESEVDSGSDRVGDVWILSDAPVTAPTLLQHVSIPLVLARSGMDMPSRIADNLFWLGRYVERAEDSVRVLRCVANRLTSGTRNEEIAELRALYTILRSLGLYPALRPKPREQEVERGNFERNLLRIVYQRPRPEGLPGVVAAFVRTASALRDRLSLDSWRTLQRIEQTYAACPPAEPFPPMTEALALLNGLLVPLAAFSGIAMESMTRGPSWHFLDMGRRIERAQYTVTLVSAALRESGDGEVPILQALLEIGESAMTYRNRYLSSYQTAAVLDLLLIDETNPRSLGFQLAALTDHLEQLDGYQRAGMPAAPHVWQLLISGLEAVRGATPDKLAEQDSEGIRSQLMALLAQLETDLPAISDAISGRYFSHLEPAQQIAGAWAAEAPR